jgi:hypothetical protein
VFPPKIRISDELRGLIALMLEKDPVRRLSLEAVKVSEKKHIYSRASRSPITSNHS